MSDLCLNNPYIHWSQIIFYKGTHIFRGMIVFKACGLIYNYYEKLKYYCNKHFTLLIAQHKTSTTPCMIHRSLTAITTLKYSLKCINQRNKSFIDGWGTVCVVVKTEITNESLSKQSIVRRAMKIDPSYPLFMWYPDLVFYKHREL